MGYLSVYYATALFGVAVQGLAYPEPRPTDKVVIPFDAQSPRPTNPPAVHELLRRQNSKKTTRTVISAPDNICGYFDGRPGAPLSCVGTTNSCVFVTSTAGMQGFSGCCDDDTCGVALDCFDMTAASQTSVCDSGCLNDKYTLKCTQSSRPYCNTLTWFGGIKDYFCNSVAISTPQSLETTYQNQVGRTMITGVITFGGETSSAFIRPPRTSTADFFGETSSEEAPSSTAPKPPPTSSAPPPQQQQSSSTPIGPIVGGAVGGVAVIGLVILGIILIMRKKPPAPAPTPAPATTQGATTQGPGPSPPPVFAPIPMGGSPPPQHPADIKYSQEPMTQAYGAVPPQNNMQGYQQPQYQQPQYQQQYSPESGQGYFAPAQQPQQQSPTDQNRISIAPPASPVSSVTSHQQQQGVTYQHLSQQSFASTQPGAQPFQPGSPAPGYQYAPPADVYEAGGHAVGGPDDHHRGQIHQLQ